MKHLRAPLRPAIRAAFRSASPTVAQLRARLSALTLLAQDSDYLFASPLGPFVHRGKPVEVPRFVFFGPTSPAVSGHIICYAGFDHRDLGSARAMLDLVEYLRSSPMAGTGLRLTLIPMVNAAGFFLGAAPRPLAAEHWAHSTAAEIGLLENDARKNGCTGFIRLQSAPPGEAMPKLRVRAPASAFLGSDESLELLRQSAPLEMRIERGPRATSGPLTMADDLSSRPFELTLRVPSEWPPQIYAETARRLLGWLLARYQSFAAAHAPI